MSPIVIDTDVLSFLLKQDSRADQYLRYLENRQWFISFMTQAELEQWALLKSWSSQRLEWLRLDLQSFTIVPSSADLSIEWARVMVAARHRGRRIDTADAWIAATATLYQAPLLTNNKADFLGVPNLMFADS